MRGWIRLFLLTSACALSWACNGGGGPIFSNPNPNVGNAASATAVVGRGTVDTTAPQISSAPLGRNDVGVVDSETAMDSNDNTMGILAAGAGLTRLPPTNASEPGVISASQSEGSASADQKAITIINIGKGKHIHVFGDGHGHPLIIIVDDTDTLTVADTIVRRDSSISVRAESAATNRVRDLVSS